MARDALRVATAGFLVFIGLFTLSADGAHAIVRDVERGEDATLVRNNTLEPLASVARVGGCSATPIAPRFAVTAAHCWVDNAGALRPLPNGAELFIEFDDELDVKAPILRRLVHPNYPRCPAERCSDGQIGCYPSRCLTSDIALLELVNPLPAYVRLYRLAEFPENPAGATVTHAGYGRTGTGETGEIRSTNGKLRYGFNRVTGVDSQGFIITNFDASDVAPCSGKGCAFRTPEEIKQTEEVTTAKGDSGGPLFYNPYHDYEANWPKNLTIQTKVIPKEYFLLGVTSHGSGGGAYGSRGGYEPISRSIAWIRNNAVGIQAAPFPGPLVPIPSNATEVTSVQTLPLDEGVCSDGADNDGDGFFDMEDPGCNDPLDGTETSSDLPCDDGRDNDGDRLVDLDDPVCVNGSFIAEAADCQDGQDNDGDGGLDFDGGASIWGTSIGEPDPGCFDSWDRSEEESACGLGFEGALFALGIHGLRRRLTRRQRNRAGGPAQAPRHA